MLLHRILTALVLIPLVIFGVLYLSTPWIALITGIIIVLGAWEWAGISGWQTMLAKTIYTSVIALILVIISKIIFYDFYEYPVFDNYALIFFAITSLAWLIPVYWIIQTQAGHDPLPKSAWIKGIIGGFILIPAWAALVYFHLLGGEVLLSFLVLIWVADSSAYFVGKLWGKRKLADKVSPGKTWEGVIGSLFVTALLTIGLPLFMSSGKIGGTEVAFLIYFVISCFIVVIASIIGDLTESLFKRHIGLKDSGNILPGHGGILDRIDGLTAAAPVATTLLSVGFYLLSTIG